MPKPGSKITGFKALRQNLNKLSKQAAKDGGKVSVLVGYTANYALHVHESAKMEARRRLRKKSAGRQQWKFLETPARDKTVQATMQKIVVASMKKVPDMKIALVAAGEHLQRKSQKIVPIDTRNLTKSAFTEPE